MLETNHSDSVQEFLEKLRVSSDCWGTTWDSEWAFRGHGDEHWKLLPSALRDRTPDSISATMRILENTDGLNRFVGNQFIRPNILHIAAESELLFQFAIAARDAGLPTPPTKRITSGVSLINERAAGFDSLLFSEDRELCALAQHRGIPTRLLDWSETGWIAAFFAAKDCFNLLSSTTVSHPEKLAVWAVNLRQLQDQSCYTAPKHIDVFWTNRGENQYLRAQRGLFTYDHRHIQEFALHGSFTEFDASVGERIDVKKFTLDALHASELLRCLYRERISQHSMMPSYESAAELAKMVPIWSTAGHDSSPLPTQPVLSSHA